MSSCSVCRGLDPTHAEFFEYFYEGGLYYYGEFAPFLQSAVGCQSCSFLFSGLLHFFSLSELENDSTKSHRSQLSIRGGKKSLEIGVQGDFQPDWQTFELYVLPGKSLAPSVLFAHSERFCEVTSCANYFSQDLRILVHLHTAGYIRITSLVSRWSLSSFR